MSIIAALRILAYGKSLDQMVVLCNISATFISKSLASLITELVEPFDEKYLKYPFKAELRLILVIHSQRGLSGYVNSEDFQH